MVGKDFWLEVADMMLSGKYKQTTGRLFELDRMLNECYCAEGIVCEALVKRGLMTKESPFDTRIYTRDGIISTIRVEESTRIDLDLELEIPIDIVRKNTSMPIDWLKGGYSQTTFSLIDLNDGLGCTFEQIGNMIKDYVNSDQYTEETKQK